MEISFKDLQKRPLLTLAGVSLLLLCLFVLGRSKSPVYSGTVEVDEYLIGARATGRLIEVNVDEGQLVKQGQLIARLDRYEQRRIDYERLVEMSQLQAASKQQVEHAWLELQDQQIFSPVDGQILTKVHDLGEVIAAGLPVVSVGDIAHPWIKIYIPEHTINRVRMHQPARIALDGLKQTYQGHVGYITPRAEFTPRSVQTQEDRAGQTFAVKIYFDAIPDTLRPGVAADVTLTGF